MLLGSKHAEKRKIITMLLPNSNWEDACGFPSPAQVFPPLPLGEVSADICALTSIMFCLCTDLVTFC